jgi:hypothetical protein
MNKSVMWYHRIDPKLRDKVTSKVYLIKSQKRDYNIEQAVTEALNDWLKKEVA